MEIDKISNMNRLLLSGIDESKMSSRLAEEKSKKEFARNYESLVLDKLFSSIQTSMTEGGFCEDAGASQINDMFWMFMSQAITQKGGTGLADQIYKSISSNADSGENAKSNPVLDHKV